MNHFIITLSPSVPVVIQDLHVKSLGSLSNLVTDVSHSNYSQSRPCDFNSHQALWYMGGPGINGYLMTYTEMDQKTSTAKSSAGHNVLSLKSII